MSLPFINSFINFQVGKVPKGLLNFPVLVSYLPSLLFPAIDSPFPFLSAHGVAGALGQLAMLLGDAPLGEWPGIPAIATVALLGKLYCPRILRVTDGRVSLCPAPSLGRTLPDKMLSSVCSD